MKYIWIGMLVVAYIIWAVAAIADIIFSVKWWIDDNVETKTVTDDAHIIPTTVKEWTGRHSVWDLFTQYMEPFSAWFIVVTIGGLFLCSLFTWLKAIIVAAVSKKAA